MTERPHVEPLALKPAEAAKLLGISPRTLWAWTHSGRIPCIRIGRVIRYPYAALKAWLESHALRTGVAPGSNAERDADE
jgi:excisionase family DNA binding protein